MIESSQKRDYGLSNETELARLAATQLRLMMGFGLDPMVCSTSSVKSIEVATPRTHPMFALVQGVSIASSRFGSESKSR
jgi:hypothetical protein